MSRPLLAQSPRQGEGESREQPEQSQAEPEAAGSEPDSQRPLGGFWISVGGYKTPRNDALTFFEFTPLAEGFFRRNCVQTWPLRA